jgi:hypothetical protein
MYNIVNQDKKKQELASRNKNIKKDIKPIGIQKKDSQFITREIIKEEKRINSEKNMESIYEEYEGLSYKKSSSTPVKEITLETRKKSSGEKEKDFRAKFKTEKCKYFETNKECKFGTNVFF